MEKIHFTPKRYSLISLALGICFFMASLFFTIREGVFDNSRSIFGFLSGIVLLSLLVMSVYYLLKRPSLIIDEKGLSQTGFRAVNMLWDDIEEVKNHFILSQDFISIKTRRPKRQMGQHLCNALCCQCRCAGQFYARYGQNYGRSKKIHDAQFGLAWG